MKQVTNSVDSESTPDITHIERMRVFEAIGFNIKQDIADRSKMEHKLVATWDEGSRWKHPMCKVCGLEIKDILIEKFKAFGGDFDLTQTVCDDCKPIVDQHYQSKVRTKWDDECPAIYKGIIDGWDSKIGHINVEASKKVTSWEYQNKGMHIYGPSGKGKTTAIWKLYKSIEEKHGFTPVVINAVPLARLLAKQAKDLSSPSAWLFKCRILIIDDFGKEKMTASFAAMIYELINHRYENFKPMIITSKYDSKNLLKRFKESSDDSLGFDICRRISDVCVPVNFDE